MYIYLMHENQIPIRINSVFFILKREKLETDKTINKYILFKFWENKRTIILNICPITIKGAFSWICL